MNTKEIVLIAFNHKIVVPAFNVSYLPMLKPIVEAVVAENSFALIQVARLEWIKFEAESLKAVRNEFKKYENRKFIRLHLDHIPVIDEDNIYVNYLEEIHEALELGYESVMIDGSRLCLEDNIAATKSVVDLAHKAGVPCEAELGAVMGHEAGPCAPYEEIFASGRGFTKVDEARRFVQESGCDWLSVAVGNVHGAISEMTRGQKKPDAKLDIEHLIKLKDATGIPLVLHGGSGIQKEFIQKGIKSGIAKINVATEIRQPYENVLKDTGDIEKAREATFERTRWVLREFLEISDVNELFNA